MTIPNITSSDFEMIPTLALLVVLATLVYIICSRDPPNYPPGPTAWPILGNLIKVGRAKNVYNLFKELQREYGNVFRLRFGQQTLIFIFGHDNITKIMMGADDHTMFRPDWLFVPTVIFKKKGLVWASGKQWRLLTELIIKTQQDNKVRINMQDQIDGELTALCKKLNTGKAVDPLIPLQSSVLNIVSALLFGKRFDYDHLTENGYFQSMRRSLEFVLNNGQTLHRKETFLSCLAFFTKSKIAAIENEQHILYEYFATKLKEHRMNFSLSNQRDLLDMYIGLSETEIEEDAFSEVNLFQSMIDLYMAGYEALTSALYTTLFYMIKYPDVQQKCRLEITKNTQASAAVTLDDKDKLPYFQATIKEILRIAKPIVTTVYRTNKEKALSVGQYTIPPKSIIVLDLMDQQIDPLLWENPDEFNPDRWNKATDDGFVPFGAGPRKCVGASTAELALFQIFTNLIKKYEIQAENEELLIEGMEYTGISMRPKQFNMLLKPIE